VSDSNAWTDERPVHAASHHDVKRSTYFSAGPLVSTFADAIYKIDRFIQCRRCAVHSGDNPPGSTSNSNSTSTSPRAAGARPSRRPERCPWGGTASPQNVRALSRKPGSKRSARHSNSLVRSSAESSVALAGRSSRCMKNALTGCHSNRTEIDHIAWCASYRCFRQSDPAPPECILVQGAIT